MSKFLVELQTRLASVRDEKGATAVEYVLIVGGIALAVTAGLAVFGVNLTDALKNILP